MHVSSWLGDRDLADGHGRSWTIGPLHLWVGRRGPELWVAHESTGSLLDPSLAEEERDEPPEGWSLRRLVVGDAPEEVTLEPRTTDVPVAVRPEQTIILPSEGTLEAVVSTACWVRVGCGPHAVEVPTLPTKPTWSGLTPREGVLCHAGRTRLRPGITRIERLPHRPITAVTLHNLTDDPLELVRVRLPLPHLALYSDVEGALWTASVRMELEGDLTGASVRLATPPIDATHLVEPREPLGERFLRHLNPFA